LMGPVALLASTMLPGSAVNASGLNDTGITTCSSETQNGLPCPVADYPGQDADYGTNRFNFTKLDGNGQDLPASATHHTCVRDNVTGLIWEVKTEDNGLRDKRWTYTWYNSNSATNGGSAGFFSNGRCYDSNRCDTEKYPQDINTAGLCGFRDWRMPTPDELLSIVDNSFFNPSIDAGYFPNTVFSGFWSSSPYAADSGGAWVVSFDYGGVYGYYRRSGFAVRLVRGGQ